MAVLILAVKIRPFEGRRGQVELFGGDKCVDVLVQAVIEKAVARWISKPVDERFRAGTPTVEPGQSQGDWRAIRKLPRIKRVQSIPRPANIILKQLCVTEGGLLGGAEIDSEAISVEGIVGVLVEQRLRTFMNAAERRPLKAVSVVACA